MGYGHPGFASPTVNIPQVKGLVNQRPFAIVSVTEFGTKGDGTTDDTEAIQEAVNALPNGGVVYLPPGTYLISNPIALHSGITIQGAGRLATVIKIDDNANCDGINNATTDINDPPDADIIVRDLSVDGNRDNQPLTGEGNTWPMGSGQIGNWTAGVRFRNAKRVLVENVWCHSFTGYGIEFKAVRDGVISQCYASENGDDGISISDTGLGVVSLSENILVVGCFSWENWDADRSSPATGSGFEVDDGPKRVAFRDCHSWDNVHGFDIHAHTDEIHPQHISYVNCRSWGHTRGSNPRGLAIQQARHVTVVGGYFEGENAGIRVNEAVHVKIQEVEVSGSGDGIFVTAPGSDRPTRYVHIIGGQVHSNNRYGIAIWPGATDRVMGVQVTGAQIYENGDHGVLLNNVDDCEIKGCWFYANGQVSNNSRVHIRLGANANRNNISGNTLRKGDLENKTRYGVSIASGCNDNRVTNNDMYDAGETGELDDSGTGTVTDAGNRMT